MNLVNGLSAVLRTSDVYKRQMLMSKGNLGVFVSSPIAVFFLVMVILTVAAPLVKRKKAA